MLAWPTSPWRTRVWPTFASPTAESTLAWPSTAARRGCAWPSTVLPQPVSRLAAFRLLASPRRSSCINSRWFARQLARTQVLMQDPNQWAALRVQPIGGAPVASAFRRKERAGIGMRLASAFRRKWRAGIGKCACGFRLQAEGARGHRKVCLWLPPSGGRSARASESVPVASAFRRKERAGIGKCACGFRLQAEGARGHRNACLWLPPSGGRSARASESVPVASAFRRKWRAGIGMRACGFRLQAEVSATASESARKV